MMALMFWFLRALVGFAALLSLMVSWRVSLVLFVSLACDLFAMLAGLFSANVWTQAAIMFWPGVLLGPIAIGRPREPIWPMAALAAAVLSVLTVSWYYDPSSAREFVARWPLQLIRVCALPLGLWSSGEALRALVHARELRRLSGTKTTRTRHSP